MKKHIFGFGLMVLASAAFAELPTGDFMTWFGYESGKDANGSGTSLYGAMAGQKGSYLNYSLLLGTLSGYNAYDVNRSVGVGPWSLHGSRNVSYTEAIGASAGRSATNCQDCVFIGSGAGRETANCTNCVFIGKDAGRSHRGLKDWVDIGGLIGISDGGYGRKFDLRFSRDGDPVVSLYGNAFHRTLILEPGIEINCAGWNIHRSGLADFSRAMIAEGVSYVTEGVYGPHMSFDMESGCLRVFTNSVYAATFEPKRTTPPKSLEIEDEDTGEKYIIKVKSGALKLYKVEETEE